MANTLYYGDNLDVLPDFVLIPWKYTDIHAIVWLDTRICCAEGLSNALVGYAPGGQNLECKTGFLGLAHHFVHARRVALHINIVRHLEQLAIECLLPLLLCSGAIIDTA